MAEAKTLEEGLYLLNVMWGRGTLISVDRDARTFTCRLQYGREIRAYRMAGHVLHARGHQISPVSHTQEGGEIWLG